MIAIKERKFYVFKFFVVRAKLLENKRKMMKKKLFLSWFDEDFRWKVKNYEKLNKTFQLFLLE